MILVEESSSNYSYPVVNRENPGYHGPSESAIVVEHEGIKVRMTFRDCWAFSCICSELTDSLRSDISTYAYNETGE